MKGGSDYGEKGTLKPQRSVKSGQNTEQINGGDHATGLGEQKLTIRQRTPQKAKTKRETNGSKGRGRERESVER